LQNEPGGLGCFFHGPAKPGQESRVKEGSEIILQTVERESYAGVQGNLNSPLPLFEGSGGKTSEPQEEIEIRGTRPINREEGEK